MKRTRRKSILREIRGNLNRFFSILFIVALGSGFMAGLAATSPDMYATADRYMDENSMYDLDIKSTLGITEEDVAAVRALEEVSAAEGARLLDAVLDAPDGESYTCRISATLNDEGKNTLNGFVLKSGRLPENSSECVIQPTHGRYFDGAIREGDVLTLSQSNADYDSLAASFSSDRLTVVGFVESPTCISITAEASSAGTGSIALNVYAMEDFCTLGFYTDLFILAEGVEALDAFGEEYGDRIASLCEKVSALGESRAPLRVSAVRAEYQKAIDSLSGLIGTLEAVGEIRTGLGKDAAERLFGNAAVAQAVSEGSPELAALLLQTQEAVQRSLKEESEQSDQELLQVLEDSLSAQNAALEALGDGSWIIRTRSDSVSFSTYDGNVGKVAALSKIFPVFFFMVALLVALTTMTRLVEETRGKIGTLKALGFTNGQILGEYMVFSLSSSVLGCALGFGVGFRLFPRVISAAYGMMFTLPDIETPFRLSIAACVAPVTIGSIVLATLWVCGSVLRSCPAELMRPQAPAAGKRIWLEHIPWIWHRLSFTRKVTFRNIFRYKKRFFMTVIGVAGCSALLLTGFGLRDSINDIVDLQYGEIYHYDLSVSLKSADGAEAAMGELLQDGTVKDALLYAGENGNALADGKREALTLFTVKDSGALADFVTLRSRKSGEPFSPTENGAVLTEKLCETLRLSIGDRVTLEREDGRRGELTVVGIAENYITSYAYLTGEGYRAAFGDEPSYDTLLCHVPDAMSTDDAIRTAMSRSDVLYAGSTESLKASFADSIKSINGVILVLILSAGLLSVVVLYNLTNVNICERRKELATMRVLGFHRREVERYIFRETDLLSFFGALVGLLVGVWLHAYVVRTVEVDQVMFGRSIYPLSFLYALLISCMFTALVNWIMRRTVSRIDMVEAMKAND